MKPANPKDVESKLRIILGITGGIAAYKAAELVRQLVKTGTQVQVVMTEAATHFISPTTMQGLSGSPVLTSQWDETEPNGMAHINLSRHADAIIIAPASADFIAKLAHGLAGDLLSTLCLARDCPLFIAPAMNRSMWLNPATQRSITLLQNDGVQIFGPETGIQACGEEGLGRMVEAAALCSDLLAAIKKSGQKSSGELSNTRVIITAGPTYEPIDAVRGITNRSSGKMGYAIVRAAIERGAQVLLISGPTALPKPAGAIVLEVTTADQMHAAVMAYVGNCDIFISVAAVADYRVAHVCKQKIKKKDGTLKLELVANPDILASVASLDDPPFCVGFAAESENLYANAEQKRRAKKVPLLVGNLAQQAIGSDENELVLFEEQGSKVLPRADKLTLARSLLEHIAQRFHGIK